MKKVILTLATVTTLLVSCNDKKTETAPATDTVKAADSMSTDSTVVDSTQIDTAKVDTVKTK
ncbi:MAG: hypothetical protein ACOVJ5_00840 [Gloeomargaritales cyanobacterium]